jgi:hypothetical protein
MGEWLWLVAQSPSNPGNVVVVVVVVVGGGGGGSVVVVVVVGGMMMVVVVVGGTVVVVVGGLVGVGDVTVAPGVPKVKGSFTKVGRADSPDFDLVGGNRFPSGMRAGVLVVGAAVAIVGVGVAEPITTCSPFGRIVVAVAAAVSWVEDLPTKSMALSPATITAPATMIDHRQNVSSPPGSAATFSPQSK